MAPMNLLIPRNLVLRIGLGVLAALALACGCMKRAEPLPPAAEVAPAVPKPPDRWAPIILPTADAGPWPVHAAPAPSPAPAAATAWVDENTHAVHLPARFTHARGVVEWLLSARARHFNTSSLVTDVPARDLAAALAKAGLAPGKRPRPVDEDRVQPPVGAALEIEVVTKDRQGRETRLPAGCLLSRESDGPPLGEGTWVYVGVETIEEGDALICVTALSGSLITTNLRDLSAMIYWVSKSADPAPRYAATCYGSNVPLPGDASDCELVIRPAGP